MPISPSSWPERARSAPMECLPISGHHCLIVWVRIVPLLLRILLFRFGTVLFLLKVRTLRTDVTRLLAVVTRPRILMLLIQS